MVRTDLSRVLYRCACRSTLQCAYIYPSGPNFWSEALRSSWRRIVLRAFHVSNPTDKQAHIRWVCVQKREDRQGDSRRRIMAMAVKARARVIGIKARTGQIWPKWDLYRSGCRQSGTFTIYYILCADTPLRGRSYHVCINCDKMDEMYNFV